MTSMEITDECVQDGAVHITMGLTTNIFAPTMHVQPEAEAAQDEVTTWMRSLTGLGAYAASVPKEGYHELIDLKNARNADLWKCCMAVGMKKPEARKFMQSVQACSFKDAHGVMCIHITVTASATV